MTCKRTDTDIFDLQAGCQIGHVGCSNVATTFSLQNHARCVALLVIGLMKKQDLG